MATWPASVWLLLFYCYVEHSHLYKLDITGAYLISVIVSELTMKKTYRAKPLSNKFYIAIFGMGVETARLYFLGVLPPNALTPGCVFFPLGLARYDRA